MNSSRIEDSLQRAAERFNRQFALHTSSATGAQRDPFEKRPLSRYPRASRQAIGWCAVLCLILTMGIEPGRTEDFRNALSLQGFTGLLNTPNAEVTDEGEFAALYSNQKESQWRNRASREESYLFSVGLLPFVEIGGRLTDAPPDTRDLSANVKVKLPFGSGETFLPDVAIGMQDVGGGSALLRTKYLVASETWGRFRFSLGYGDGSDRMGGVFGGVEVKTFDWLYLIGENDTKETNVGIRLATGGLFGSPVKLEVAAKTSLDYRPGNMEFGIGLQIPLGVDRNNRTPLVEEHSDVKTNPPEGSGPSQSIPAYHPSVPPFPAELLEEEKGSRADLQVLRQNLVAGGFQNVRVGTDGDAVLLVVEYENSRYNHNELDGLGVVIGTIVDTVAPGFEILQVIVRKKGIRVLQLSAPLADFQNFLRDADAREALSANLEITPDVAIDKEVSFVSGDANPSWLKSELVVYPGLKTFVGTEVGKFDYLLSIKPDYYLNVWKGAVLNARWDIPVDWSENFDDGRLFRDSRKGSQFERLMFLQALKIAPGVMLNLGAGMILHETYGTINELMWTPGSGNHRITLKQAYTSSSESGAAYPQNKAYLGAYRYFYAPLDLYLEGTAGQFLDNDRGFMLELKRFFGDTSFSAFYKNSRTSAHEHVEVGGVMISLPLTLRRDMKPLLVQVKGSEEWAYAQETKIVASGNANYVNTSIGVTPRIAYNHERVFYNRDRLSEDYIRKHLLRLRDAYLTYR
jgi:hypothetical protein